MALKDVLEYGAIISAALIYSWNEIRKERRSKKKIHSGLDKNLSIDSEIYPILWQIMTQYRSVRCYIVQFHNGSVFYTGQSIQRMSVSHEVIYQRSVRKLKEYFDNISISQTDHEILLQVKKTDLFCVTDVDNIRADYEELTEMMDVYGARSLYVFRIIDKHTKETVATLNMHFNHPNPLNELEVDEIMEEKKKLESIFDNL